jgi:predicted amidohydrolase
MALKRTIGVVQMDCVLGDTKANIDTIEAYAKTAGKLGIELLIFPETCTTGYFLGSRLGDLAEPADGPSSKRLGTIAREAGIHMAVGAFTQRDNCIYNSQLLFGPDGKLIEVYDKAHLFAGEREFCQAGSRPVIADTAMGKLGMTICYDLVFPDYIRSLVDNGADMVINSTDWINDTYQREIWQFGGPVTIGLATTRALENLTILAMANRVGREKATPELEFTSFGHSVVTGPSGKILASLTDGEGLAFARIDYSDADVQRWTGIATYKQDRRPELMR